MVQAVNSNITHVKLMDLPHLHEVAAFDEELKYRRHEPVDQFLDQVVLLRYQLLA